MSARRSLFVYGSIGVIITGCGGKTQEGVSSGSKPLENGTPDCIFSDPSTGWANGTFPSQSEPFTISVSLSTSAAEADALFGLSSGAATTYSDLATIVRFNPQGLVDFRNGGAYTADQALSYQAHSGLRVTLGVDPVSHTYTVRQSNAPGPPLASGYGFRTEQANASTLDHFAVKVDGAGTFGACNVQVEPASACWTAVPSGGFQNHGYAPQASLLQVSFRATPNADHIDGVVGFSGASTSNFGDLTAAIRFNPDGFIDVRNGTGYAADTQVPYYAGAVYLVEATLDIARQTYSVYVNGETFATNFAFRPQGASVASLSNVAVVADSEAGSLSVCDLSATRPADVVYLHDLAVYDPSGGGTSFAPSDDGGLFLTTGDVRRTLDGSGRVIASDPAQARWPADLAGNSYASGTFSGTYDVGAGAVTSAGGTDVYVSKYDIASRPVWTRHFGGMGDDVLLGTAVDDAGDVVLLVAASPSSDGAASLVRLKTDGSTLSTSTVSHAAFAMARDGSLVVLEDGTDTFVISSHDASGATRWGRTLPAQAEVWSLRSDPGGGVVFSGRINGSIDFGGGHTLTSRTTESGPLAFIAKLDSSGAYVYANVPDMHEPNDLFVAANGKAYLSGTHFNLDEPRLAVYDASGNFVYGRGIEIVAPRHLGFASGVSADATGRIFWSFSARNGGSDSATFLAALAP